MGRESNDFPVFNIYALGWLAVDATTLEVVVRRVLFAVHSTDGVNGRYALRGYGGTHLNGDIQQEIA